MLIIKYLEQAGLAYKGYTLQCVRHTFASETLNAGMRLECLQQLLGHTDIQATNPYERLFAAVSLVITICFSFFC